MKRLFKSITSLVLALILLLQLSESCIVYAVEAVDQALNPAEHIELIVPDSLQDGNNYFFIRQNSYSVSENSDETLYIPIQRSGDLSQEAEVTLKVVELTARHGVNYELEIYKNPVKPEIALADISLMDVVAGADSITEEEAVTEAELGSLVYEAGGADILDTEGNPIGSLTAYPVDGEGNPLPANPSGQSETEPQVVTQPDAVTEPEGPAALMAARNAFTGTASDRQEYQEPERGITGASTNLANDLDPAKIVEDAYPGREYRLHFAPGQEAQFVVIRPLYSDECDGDSQLTLTLKNASENTQFPENFGPASVIIVNEDTPEPISFSVAADTVSAEDGEAVITVTRSGRLKTIVGVRIASWDGSAVQGQDYGGVGADLYFPMGITQRTIELPVGNGAEEKDFYVTITPLAEGPEVEIDCATTHVLIPAAPLVEEEEADLMADGPKYGPAINLKELRNNLFGSKVKWLDDNSFNAETEIDVEWSPAGLDFRLPDAGGYFYDGMRVQHQIYDNFCKTKVQFGTRNEGKESWQNLWNDIYQSEGIHSVFWLNYYYGTEVAPNNMLLSAMNRDNSGYAWTDNYTRLNVYSVEPILRRFDITVVDAAPLAFEGMEAEEVLRDYETAIPNGDGKSEFSLWSGENFSISRPKGVTQPRFVGVEAVRKSDGKTYRLATIDGKSSTVVVELTQAHIDYMGKNGYITWNSTSGEGNPTYGQSFSGAFTVRPVFEYDDVTVEVRDTPEGVLKYNGKELPAGTYTFHKGDKLVFEPNSAAPANFRATGVGYVARIEGKSGKIQDQNQSLPFIAGSEKFPLSKYPDGAREFTLVYDYYEFWQTFTAEANAVRVQIPQDQVQYFDTAKGLFANLTPETRDGYAVYTVRKEVQSNELVDLTVVPVGENRLPVWKLPGNPTEYGGNTFYFQTGAYPTDNLVTLSAAAPGDNRGWYVLLGNVYTSTMNLATGQKAADKIAAQYAVVTAGTSSLGTVNLSSSDPNGKFTLPNPLFCAGGSILRYTVAYNGVTSIREVKLPPASSPKKSYAVATDGQGGATNVDAVPVDVGELNVDSFSLDGIRFASISMSQSGVASGIVDAMKMNGRSLRFVAKVDPGQGYLVNGVHKTENIKDLTLYFQNQYTGEVHGMYSILNKDIAPENTKNMTGVTMSWDADTLTAYLTIEKFSPDRPGEWTYGDVLMARLTTDRKQSVFGMDSMTYDPVSSGYAVYTDLDYVPETFSYDVPNMAELLKYPSNDAKTQEEGKTRYSFGDFPYLGEIMATLHVVRTLASIGGLNSTAQQIASDVASDMDEETADEIAAGGYADDGLKSGEQHKEDSNVAISFYFNITKTPFGGVRFLIGAAVNTGGGSGYKRMRNPYKSAKNAWAVTKTRDHLFVKNWNLDSDSIQSSNVELIRTPQGALDVLKKSASAAFGGPYFTVTIYFGLAFDFGYIREATTTADGKTQQKSGEMVYMGVYGFVGFKGSVGVVVPFYCVFPMYFAPEASIDIRFFIGEGANPNKTLASFQKEKNHKGQDFKFNIEILGTINAGANVGIGVYKVLGGRIYVGVSFELGYGMRMAEWYPNVSSNWGTMLKAEFSGTLDLLITSISLYSVSIPVTGSGWLDYVDTVTLANRLIAFVNKGISDGKGSQEARNRCRQMADKLADDIDSISKTEKEINTLRKELLSYAYDQDVITLDQYHASRVHHGGVVGSIVNAALTGDDQEEPQMYFTREHVDSQWVAGQDAQLMGAFTPVKSSKLVENAFVQTSSQIQPIGNGKYLVVFLDDGQNKDKAQASTLKYNIYDANTDTFTLSEPGLVTNAQLNQTADSKPNLVDGGDKLILSWASTTNAKYRNLKETIAKELNVYHMEEDTVVIEDTDQVIAAMEDDPARVMSQMDIFSVCFDKATQTFGKIEQLTDDGYYDDYPQAIYDPDTGDYIVIYNKTSQTASGYSSNQDKLQDLLRISPSTNKTYGVVCYMLYNNRNGLEDATGQTQSAGWARNYLFEKETSLAPEAQANFLKQWGGQRFLSSTITSTDANGKVIQSDPPIADLTVCNAKNDMGPFAFTVDKDFNLGTVEDRELYMQYYRFSDHAVMKPIRVAGESTEDELFSTDDGIETRSVTKQVEVGTPRLIRNGGSTFLFWRENLDGLRYLNVSELLKKKLLKDADADPSVEGNWIYAMNSDGTFATDPSTGLPYKPEAYRVDFGSARTDRTLNLTDFQVFADEKDNLYVAWTQSVNYSDPEALAYTSETTAHAQEIYVTAKIKEEDQALIREETDEEGTITSKAVPCAWSKPYRLTRDNMMNDGLAITLDEKGGLIILHNQFKKLYADTEEKLAQLVLQGKGAFRKNQDGETVFIGSPWYDSDIDLMLTRCDAVGSVEATEFQFSDLYPMPGEKVRVTAFVENTGLTTADSYAVDFYEYKDGVQTRKLHSVEGTEKLPVNTSRTVRFTWEVPAEGVEGYSIQAVAREGRTGGDPYDPVVTYSDTFVPNPAYAVSVHSIQQNGDLFDVEFHVTNVGNLPAEEETKATLTLQALHGDLKEVYGMEDDLLLEEDLTGLAPRTSRTVQKSLSIPVSVFEYCGYDAVRLEVRDLNETILESTEDVFVSMDEPVHLQLNQGNGIRLNPAESATATLSYDTTVFLEDGGVHYHVDDPSVATVDENGLVTALGVGTANLTATLLPSGKSTSIPLTVRADTSDSDDDDSWSYSGGGISGSSGSSSSSGGGSAAPAVGGLSETQKDALLSQFSDLNSGDWYRDGVAWALSEGIMNGVGGQTFAPATPTTRSMIVTMLYRLEGQPKYDGSLPFTDVEAGSWYANAVGWAASKGIVTGYDASTFGPDDVVTREQLATILYRYAQTKGLSFQGTFALNYPDAASVSSWADEAMLWIVKNKVINGMGDGTLNPGGEGTRAQVATMLMRFTGVTK